MLTRITMVALIMMMQLAPMVAQDKADRAAKPFCEISANGSIRADGELIGKIDRRGTIFKNGVAVGYISKDGYIKGVDGDSVGYVDDDGNVLNHARVQVGTIEKDGTLRDAMGLRVGAAAGVSKRWAAVVFFFF